MSGEKATSVSAAAEASTFAMLRAFLDGERAWHWSGTVLDAAGQSMECAGPLSSIGECCEIVDAAGKRYAGETIGFRGKRVLAMPLVGVSVGVMDGAGVCSAPWCASEAGGRSSLAFA